MLIFLTGIHSSLHAQVDLFPASYGIIKEARVNYNPALLNISGKYEVLLGNQFFPGTYSQLENHFLIASVNLSNDTLRTKNNVGFKLISEKEGEFIRRPKGYISYAFHTAIFKDYHLSAGINIGWIGYNYKASNISAEGSDYGPDADIGIAFYNSGFTFGLAINQLLNTLVTPKIVPFKFKRFSTLYIEKSISISQNSNLIVSYQHQSVKSFHQNNCVGIHALLQKMLLAGLYVMPQERLTFTLGVQNLTFVNNKFNLIFGYNTPLKISAQSNIQSFEIMLTYIRM